MCKSNHFQESTQLCSTLLPWKGLPHGQQAWTCLYGIQDGKSECPFQRRNSWSRIQKEYGTALPPLQPADRSPQGISSPYKTRTKCNRPQLQGCRTLRRNRKRKACNGLLSEDNPQRQKECKGIHCSRKTSFQKQELFTGKTSFRIFNQAEPWKLRKLLLSRKGMQGIKGSFHSRKAPWKSRKITGIQAESPRRKRNLPNDGRAVGKSHWRLWKSHQQHKGP